MNRPAERSELRKFRTQERQVASELEEDAGRDYRPDLDSRAREHRKPVEVRFAERRAAAGRGVVAELNGGVGERFDEGGGRAGGDGRRRIDEQPAALAADQRA